MEEILRIVKNNSELLINQSKFLKSPSFWVSTILAIFGIIVSAGAWVSANNAKKAAIKAKISLSIKEIENDLNVAISKLEGIKKDISYDDLRTILMQIISEIQRIKSILELDETVDKETLEKLEVFGTNLFKQLQNNKPDSSLNIKNTMIFDGMESSINDSIMFLSSLIGKIQARNLDGE